MTYVVNETCIKCKHTDCVTVCPVDCFKEGENMLIIDPDECIDCGVCVPECPIEAIVTDNNETRFSNGIDWVQFAKQNAHWPVITQKKDALPDHEQWRNVPNKIDHAK